MRVERRGSLGEKENGPCKRPVGTLDSSIGVDMGWLAHSHAKTLGLQVQRALDKSLLSRPELARPLGQSELTGEVEYSAASRQRGAEHSERQQKEPNQANSKHRLGRFGPDKASSGHADNVGGTPLGR